MKYHLTKSIVMIFIIAMLFACKNKMSEVAAINFSDSLPDITARDIDFTFSDSARVQVRISGPIMHAYEEGDDPYMEFPEGFKVEFYDSTFNITSTITGEYGIHYRDKGLMEARNNVVVTNYETGEQLNTEELIWDQKKKIIFSNKFVKISSDEGVIFGDGLEAEQDFSKRRILNPSGEIEVRDDSENVENE